MNIVVLSVEYQHIPMLYVEFIEQVEEQMHTVSEGPILMGYEHAMVEL